MKLSDTSVIENIKNCTLLQAIEEGFVQDENVDIDASHFEARDQVPAQEKKDKPEPKKRGRKKKEEKERYDQQKLEEDQNKTLYEKNIAEQLDVSLEELRSEILLSQLRVIRKIVKEKMFSGMGTKLI